MEDRPIGRQAEGDVPELEDLIEREGEREEGGPKQGQREAESGHGEEEDVGKDDKDVMERNDALPTEAREKSDAAEFLVEGKGLKVCDDEITKGKESQWDGDGEETMPITCLKDER